MFTNSRTWGTTSNWRNPEHGMRYLPWEHHKLPSIQDHKEPNLDSAGKRSPHWFCYSESVVNLKKSTSLPGGPFLVFNSSPITKKRSSSSCGKWNGWGKLHQRGVKFDNEGQIAERSGPSSWDVTTWHQRPKCGNFAKSSSVICTDDLLVTVIELHLRL
jgi:hypothetical protein